jgi:FkbM family methyltransferase
MLSPKFRRVVTVEPEPKNLECLRANLSECNNVRIVAGVLDMVPGKAKLNYRETSSGGHHIMTRKDRPWIEVDMYQMDTLVDLQKERVGLIMLDIEGYELQALIGATAIIEKDHPVIVIEENGGAKKFGFRTDAARRWLMSEGYEVVDEFDEDLVMVWRPS